MEFPIHIHDVWISDPFVLTDPKTGLYYIYSRFFKMNELMPEETGKFYAICSKDLIHWSEPRVVFEQGDFWANKDYWAPECHIWNGKYYISSSFRADGKYRGCQFLVADHPLGPFKPVAPDPVTPKGWQCLDGTLFADEDDKPWMIFCHEWMQVYDGQIAAIPLSDDLGHAIGDPIILFRASDAPWRKPDFSHGGNVTDGPFMHRMQDGSLIMLWSNFTDNGYAVGFAKSESGTLFGPWKQDPTPIYGLDGGHSMLFYTFEGQLMMSLHSPNAFEKKRALFFEMEESNGRLCIVNEVTGNWYDNLGGNGAHYCYDMPCAEEAHFRLGIGTQEVHIDE